MFLTGVWYLDLDLNLSLVFGTPKFQIFALYHDFEGAKNPCPLSPDLGFGEGWRFPTGVWHIDLDLYMINGL